MSLVCVSSVEQAVRSLCGRGRLLRCGAPLHAWMIAIAVGVLSSLWVPAYAADIRAGKIKAETCLGCHGIPGYSTAYPSYHVPKVGGQHAAYIVKKLKDYRAGCCNHPGMIANAASLSDEDIADIAAYFSSVK